VVTFSPVLYSFTCLLGTNLLVLSGSAAGGERDQGRKGKRLALGLHICYCFILIVPSNSRLQAALCVWGSMTVQKLFCSIYEVFFLSFILQLSFFFSLKLHIFFNFTKKYYLSSFSSKLSFTCC